MSDTPENKYAPQGLRNDYAHPGQGKMTPGVAYMLIVFWVAMAVFAFAEIYVSGTIGRLLGLWTALGVLAVKSVFGLRMLVREGPSTFRRLVRIVFQQHRIPGVVLLEGAYEILAAVLITLPGFLSGFLGALLLIPRVRLRLSTLSRDWLVTWLSGHLLH